MRHTPLKQWRYSNGVTTTAIPISGKMGDGVLANGLLLFFLLTQQWATECIDGPHDSNEGDKP